MLSESGDNLFSFSAGGLKDFTRVAASDPTMWTDIALMNHDNILGFIDCYQKSLKNIRDLINTRDAEALRAELTKIRAACRSRIK